ncbi:hypothetical protein PCE1_000348 [Barthelona sp. PCE]
MDKYSRVRVVGKGSFGKAILVRSRVDNKQYIIKQINVSQLSSKEKAEASNEIRVLSQMNHPYIVTYRESFIHQKSLCIVMDFAENGDLYEAIKKRRGRHFSEGQIWKWFTQICLALKHVHDRKILHRDLKTQNIFINKDNTLSLGDFGIARVLKSTMECAVTAIGTPYYLSPEICEDKPYNMKSDIWSLGCILYEMVTHRHAFDAQNMRGLVLKILRGRYPRIPSHYSSELSQLIDTMLQKNPKRRPTINQLLKMPRLQQNVHNMLSKTLVTAEFSHTIIHNKPGIEMQAPLPQGMTIIDPRNRKRRNLVRNPDDYVGMPRTDPKEPEAKVEEPEKDEPRRVRRPSSGERRERAPVKRPAIPIPHKKHHQSILDRVANDREKRHKAELERQRQVRQALLQNNINKPAASNRKTEDRAYNDYLERKKKALENKQRHYRNMYGNQREEKPKPRPPSRDRPSGNEQLDRLKARKNDLQKQRKEILEEKERRERQRIFEENKKAAEKNRLNALRDQGIVPHNSAKVDANPRPQLQAHQKANEILSRIQKLKEDEARRNEEILQKRRDEEKRKREEHEKRMQELQQKQRMLDEQREAERRKREAAQREQERIRHQQMEQERLEAERIQAERVQAEKAAAQAAEKERLEIIAQQRAARLVKMRQERKLREEQMRKKEEEDARLAEEKRIAEQAELQRQKMLALQEAEEARERERYEARRALEARLLAEQLSTAPLLEDEEETKEEDQLAEMQNQPLHVTINMQATIIHEDEEDEEDESVGPSIEVTEEEANKLATIILQMEDIITAEDDDDDEDNEEEEEEEGEDNEFDLKNEMGKTGRFVFKGKQLQLAKAKEHDSLCSRVETLRVFIENSIGLDPMLSSYCLVHDLTDTDSPETEDEVMGQILQALGDKHQFLNLICQLIYCEDRINQH